MHDAYYANQLSYYCDFEFCASGAFGAPATVLDCAFACCASSALGVPTTGSPDTMVASFLGIALNPASATAPSESLDIPALPIEGLRSRVLLPPPRAWPVNVCGVWLAAALFPSASSAPEHGHSKLHCQGQVCRNGVAASCYSSSDCSATCDAENPAQTLQ